MLSNDQLALKHVTLPVLAVLMIVGNGALIVITLRHKSLRSSVTHLLMASLALSDLLTGLFVVPLVVLAENGRFGCSQYACLAVFCLTAAQVRTRRIHFHVSKEILQEAKLSLAIVAK